MFQRWKEEWKGFFGLKLTKVRFQHWQYKDKKIPSTFIALRLMAKRQYRYDNKPELIHDILYIL
jgi:hypothetical protein